jgi:polysaccharide pyruvyl transferase WcaK-like protein
MSTFLLRLVRSADVVVDISGGDSFTTLYGDLRYRYVSTPKRLALELNRPLVLAPQTYGPFDDAHAGDAAGIIRQASMAWGRDLRAASYLKENGLEGNWCPDVAFTLPVGQASVLETDRPLIGVNVSGLLWHPEPAHVRDRFDISLDYKALMRHVVSSLMSRHPGHAIVLIPHVLTSSGSMEDDQMAATELRSSMGSDGSALQVAPPFSNPMEAKALIGKCDIMVGTRMHACIAGLSSGVPTIGFGYSHKTRPVFETVSMQEFVVDLPRASIEGATAQFDEALAQVDGVRPALQESVVSAKTAVGSFFDALLGVL